MTAVTVNQDNRPVTIYGLVDPRNNQVRYVGQTRISLKRRLGFHLNLSKQNSTRPLVHWMREVLGIGSNPEIIELETVESSQWEEAEQFWIAYLKYIGANLTNLAIGGKASLGHKVPADVRQKISRSHIGLEFSPKQRAGISKALKGRNPAPHVHEAAMRAIRGKSLTPEHKKKVSDALKGRIFTEETKMKMSAAFKGRKFSEESIMRGILSHRLRSAKQQLGVCPSKNGRWRALISIDKKQVHLGSFATKEEALARRKEAEKLHWGIE